jgi:hypothetical protein
MFARGWACLHTAHLPVSKIPSDKPCVSITSKLIEIKRLQVLYFGHLRKTGGWGSPDFVVAELQIGHPIGKSAGPVEASGAQRARIKASATLGNREWEERSWLERPALDGGMRSGGKGVEDAAEGAAEFADWAGVPCLGSGP